MTESGDGPIGRAERDALFAPLATFPVIVVAVSGGPDSTALLHLVQGWTGTEDRAAGSVVAVTVDHGLRPESAIEAEDVARQARSLGIEHRIVRWEGPAPATGLQAAARVARYRLLGKVAGEKAAAFGGPAAIITAHTADDQAETLIMRLARGSGVDGLASISPHSRLPVASSDTDVGPDRCAVLRPLLGVPRRRLLATLAARAITYADDPSNRDRRFERVRVREALGVLEGLGLTREALQRSVERLQSAREVLERAADELQSKAVASIGGLVYEIDLAALSAAPKETAVRVVRRVLRRAGGGAPPADLGAVELAAGRLVEGTNLPAFTLGGCIVEVSRADRDQRGIARIYREPDRDGGLPVIRLFPGAAALWDERFHVAVTDVAPHGVEVGPLGDDWLPLVADLPALAALHLPHAAARGAPAFRAEGRLVAVPLLAGLLAQIGAGEAADRLADLRGQVPARPANAVFLTRPVVSA